MTVRSARDTFPLRFKNAHTREALKHLAEQTGSSMTDIAERAIEHELALQGADLERRLAEALEVVRSYAASPNVGAYLDAAAEGEQAGLDPMRDVRALHTVHDQAAGASPEDPYGVLAAFSRS